MIVCVDWFTLCVAHIEGYAGVMIGILCALSPGYSCGGEVISKVSCCKDSSFGEAYLWIPHPDLQRTFFNVPQHDGLRPIPLPKDDEEAANDGRS